MSKNSITMWVLLYIPFPILPSVETSSQIQVKRTPQWAKNQHPHSGTAGSL